VAAVRSLRAHFLRLDPALYLLWAAFCTIASARLFYGYMMAQTGGEWSAPLDDVFIHFDYARRTAAGHPFEWAAGNGYSSGNTSLTYPFVLALGYLVGFTGLDLMRWAAILAMTCTFGTLLVARRIFEIERSMVMRIGSYLLPVTVVWGVGALAWSLWSGMEVAWFLATWAITLAAFLSLDRSPLQDWEEHVRGRAAWLGAAGALLVATRPEASIALAVFGVAAILRRRKRTLSLLFLIGGPGIAVLLLQTLANRIFTGEWSQNGAIVKLASLSPFLTQKEKLADWYFNLKYSVFRNTEYHFADSPSYGMILPALALAAIAMPHTRRFALILMLQAGSWLMITALNGQVRWQNERYTMPAVAWVMMAAALGAAGLFDKRGRPNALLVIVASTAVAQAIGSALRPPDTSPDFRVAWLAAIAAGLAAAALLRWRPIRMPIAIAALGLAAFHQMPKMRDQKWFFGRACRNIRDQHLVAGRYLQKIEARRVLVGDAGALIYESGRPGLDIIGLGGYHDLPFARAGVNGLPATLELIERMPKDERPDVFAIYPTWWGVLPVWFSQEVLARFPVEGNVICGGYEDVIYKADWSKLGTGESPREPKGKRVVDTMDVADLVSEKRHHYVMPAPAGGWTDMKILPDPSDASEDLFDAGRRFGPGLGERFQLRIAFPNNHAWLVVRTAPDKATRVHTRVNGREVAVLDLDRKEGWDERVIDLGVPTELLDVELVSDGPGDFVDYHVWLVQ
jgi:hypothetical protein